jgi:methylisocitrate lyase
MHFTKKNYLKKREDLKKKLTSKKLLKFPGAYNALTAKLIAEINFVFIFLELLLLMI